MLCHRCHVNEATVHIQEIIQGSKKALHLCTECAAKEKLLPVEGGEFNLKHLVDVLQQQMGDDAELEIGLASETPPGPPSPAPEEVPDISCNSCGISLAETKRNGRMGCPGCYSSFANYILPMLEQMHTGIEHKGKHPEAPVEPGAAPAERIRQLTDELQRAVSIEDYERAGKIRDELSTLTGGEGDVS